MTLTHKIVLAAVCGAMLGIAVIAGILSTQTVGAAASDFSQPCTTASATTTLAYLTPGNGTTTLTCNLGSTHRLANDTAVLHIQATATATGVATPTVLARIEQSRNGIDWYATVVQPVIATSSLQTSDPFASLSLKMSTSTVSGFGGTGTASRLLYSLNIPITEPYSRVVFTSPTGGGNYGIWAELYGKLEL